MPTFHAALTALAGLTVPGVAHNYDITLVPDALARAQLPALLTLPLATERHLAPERGAGFEAIGFSGGPRAITYAVTHLLLLAPSAGGLRIHLPALIDLVDAYVAALSADLTLGGLLLEPLRLKVEPGIVSYGGVRYVACAFRHTWVMSSD